MRLTRVAVSAALTTRTLLRNRVALILLFLVPTLFAALVVATTTLAREPFQLAAGGPRFVVTAPQRHEGLVFIALAAAGLLTAFFALDLLRRDADATRRLVLCGFPPREMLAARLLVLAAVIAAVATWCALLVGTAFAPLHPAGVWLGVLLCGWVYGCYGLLVGALVRRELEGILCVVLLANIDVGWLQNPLYYAGAPHSVIIRALPAYLPSQVGMLAAFSDRPLAVPALGALLYGALLLAVALLLFRRRVRPAVR